jgi:hypothetical protein
MGSVPDPIGSARGSDRGDLRRLRSFPPLTMPLPLPLPLLPALSPRISRLSGGGAGSSGSGLAQPVDVKGSQGLMNVSRSGRRGAAPKTSMGLAQLAMGIDDDEVMRVGTSVGRQLYP